MSETTTGILMDTFRRATAPLMLITGIFFLNFIARILLGPLLLPLTDEFGLSLSRGGMLFILISTGYSIGVLIAGTVSARLGHHGTITTSLALLGATLIWTGAAGSFSAVLAAQFLLGLGAGFYLPSGVATITDMIPATHWGKAFAVHELAPGLSFILAPILVEFFVTCYSWRTLYLCLGLVCLGVAPLYHFRGQHGKFPGQFPKFANLARLIRLSRFWVVSMGLILAVGSEVGVYNLIPAYLVHDLGMSRESANQLLAVSRVACLPAAFGAGWLVDRIGLRRSMLLFLFLTGIATMGLAVPSRYVVGVLLFCQPIFIIGMFPASFAALSCAVPQKMNNLSVSVAVAGASIIGGGVIPAGLASLGERAGFQWSFILMGTVLLTGMACFRNIVLTPEG
jgi:fucose permease